MGLWSVPNDKLHDFPICAGFGIIIPQADMSVMMPLMFGMLGISGMRSYDKMKKTDTKK